MLIQLIVQNMYLDELNPAQREAVLCCDSPSLVIAGAGSGKTRVLTYKIAYLLEQGMQPWNILALTFTNKAAREMKERISRQVGDAVSSGLWMGTFHSIFGRILRIEADRIGFTPDFTIYDSTDSKSLIKGLIKEMGLDDKKYKPSVVAGHISAAKNSLILPSSYAMNRDLRGRDESQQMSEIFAIYDRYVQKCRQSNAMDFDDMLVYTWLLLKNNPDLCQKYQERFHFVLVDEYQDTNYAQHQIVWLLTQERQRVCVVGDDAQSIYSFRGAKIDNILGFQQMYKGAKLFKLEQNYRSTQTIVSAANSLIHHNQYQIRKDVYSHKEQGDRIEVCRAYSDVDESNIVVRKIFQFVRKNNIHYSQIAVLYRTNAQSRSLEEALRKMNIPYRIYGGLSFYQRKEIKDLIAYFRLAVNPLDEEALRRVINYPTRGIGPTTMDKVYKAALLHEKSPWEVLCTPQLLDLNKGGKEKIAKFVETIRNFNSYVQELNALECAKLILMESEMHSDIFHGTDPDDISRQENIQELVDGIASFVEERMQQGQESLLTHYLQEVSLLTDMDQKTEENDDRVNLMTVHSAKGLEFAAVIVVGLEESLFPSEMAIEHSREVEEERRLFYVAMTRAERFLVLTYAKSRMRYGKIEYSEPSRFLSEIDSSYLQREGAYQQPPVNRTAPETRFQRPLFSREPLPKAEPVTPPRGFTRVSRPVAMPSSVSSSPSSASSSAAPGGISLGCRVQHDRFGEGVVEKIEGSGLDVKATIRFQNVGVKQLLLRFAKLQVL